jgi:hypothetical protein
MMTQKQNILRLILTLQTYRTKGRNTREKSVAAKLSNVSLALGSSMKRIRSCSSVLQYGAEQEKRDVWWDALRRVPRDETLNSRMQCGSWETWFRSLQLHFELENSIPEKSGSEFGTHAEGRQFAVRS